MWTRTHLILLAALLLVACGQDAGRSEGVEGSATDGQGDEASAPDTTMNLPASDRGELSGTSWVLSSLPGRDLVEDARVTMNFREDAVGGNTGCNSYNAKGVLAEDGTFRIGPVTATQIGCKGAVGEQESAYLNALSRAESYRLRGGRLEIREASGKTILIFRKERE